MPLIGHLRRLVLIVGKDHAVRQVIIGQRQILGAHLLSLNFKLYRSGIRIRCKIFQVKVDGWHAQRRVGDFCKEQPGICNLVIVVRWPLAAYRRILGITSPVP